MKKIFSIAGTLFSWKMTKQLMLKRYRIFSVIYCAQGLVFGLASLVFAVYLQREFGLNMTQVTSALAIAHIPWFIKPVWGIMSDKIPIYGRRRIPWIVICSFIVFLSCLALGNIVSSVCFFVLAVFFLNAGFGFVDVACDALAAEKCKADPKEEGTIQSICWEARCFGVIFVCTFGGTLATWLGYKFIFNLMAIFPIIPLVVCWFSLSEENKIIACVKNIEKDSINRIESIRLRIVSLICPFDKFAKFQTYKSIFIFLAEKFIAVKLLFVAGFFLFILGMAPVFSPEASNCFLANVLGYTDSMRSWAFVVGSIGGFIGLRYCRCFLSNPETGREVNIQKIFKFTIIFGAIMGLNSIWNVYYYPIMLFFGLISAPISYIMLVTSMRVAVRACPPGVEGTVFAIMMSLSNLGGKTGGIIGSKIFDYFGGFAGFENGMPVYTDPHRGWVWMVTLACIGSLAPLVLIPMLSSFKQGGEEKETK